MKKILLLLAMLAIFFFISCEKEVYYETTDSNDTENSNNSNESEIDGYTVYYNHHIVDIYADIRNIGYGTSNLKITIPANAEIWINNKNKNIFVKNHIFCEEGSSYFVRGCWDNYGKNHWHIEFLPSNNPLLSVPVKEGTLIDFNYHINDEIVGTLIYQ